jgi:hypothetical protein
MGMLFILAAKFVGKAIKEFNIMLDYYSQEFRYLPCITRPSPPSLSTHSKLPLPVALL